MMHCLRVLQGKGICGTLKRSASQQLIRRAFGVGATEKVDPKNPPTVADVTVTVNFVDQQNVLHRVPGRIGMTLRDVASLHKLTSLDGALQPAMHASIKHTDAWIEDEFGEGPPTPLSHVILPQKWYDKLPEPLQEETDKLSELIDAHVPLPEMVTTSRLAEKVVLTKELDEIVVYMTEMPPSDIP